MQPKWYEAGAKDYGFPPLALISLEFLLLGFLELKRYQGFKKTGKVLSLLSAPMIEQQRCHQSGHYQPHDASAVNLTTHAYVSNIKTASTLDDIANAPWNMATDTVLVMLALQSGFLDSFPFDPANLDSEANAEKEIKNGRLAMVRPHYPASCYVQRCRGPNNSALSPDSGARTVPVLHVRILFWNYSVDSVIGRSSEMLQLSLASGPAGGPLRPCSCDAASLHAQHPLKNE